MKIFIATGASGGHIFPALTVADVLRARGHQVIFIGVFRQWQELLRRDGFDCIELPIRSWGVKSVKSALISSGYMLQSLICALKFAGRHRPQRVLGFGGYGSFPVVLAGWLRRIPVYIHEQNVAAGRANQWAGRLARGIMVSFPETKRAFSEKKVSVTGYPLRVFQNEVSREQSLKEFGFLKDVLTIAVCGGSQGSRALNQAMVAAGGLLKGHTDIQILHITGGEDEDIVRLGYQRQGIRHQVFAFFHDMEKIYLSADVVIARAGAGLIHEIAHFGIPAVVIPYPYAGAHQKRNAAALMQAAPGVMIEERHVTAKRLCDEILRLSGGSTVCKTPPAPDTGFVKSGAALRIADIVTGEGE